MGTLVEIGASGPNSIAVERALSDADAAIEQVDALMSFHREASELTRLNRHAVHAPQAVHPWTFAVLRRAQRLSLLSDGLFDITVAPLLVEAGLLPPTQGCMGRGGNWRHVHLLDGRRVGFERPLMLDLGGIAKGFAVDQAIHVLRRNGCTTGHVNAGGDLRRFGSQSQVIHLRTANGPVPVAELRCGAIATSSTEGVSEDRFARPIGGIFHPAKGQPWRDGGSVMVAARSCLIADALTKVAALAGPACEPLLQRFGAHARWFPDQGR